jgi:hypothetical protein
MKVPEVGEGIAFGIGGTYYREAECDVHGNVRENSVAVVKTPRTTAEFFAQTGRALLEAHERGAEWAVMGVPGPVKVEVDAEDNVSQNFRITNVPALSRSEGFDPIAEMGAQDPATQRLIENGFVFLTVNDGDLATQAAAHLYGDIDKSNLPEDLQECTKTERKYDVIADLIDGTGTGGAVVRRDKRFPSTRLFHPDPGLWEVGHIPVIPGFSSRTYEKTVSGTAIEAHCGKPAHELDTTDPIWEEIAHGLGGLVLNFAINGGAELVVLSGGTGIHGQENYKTDMSDMLHRFGKSRNPMADKVPDVRFAPRKIADTYEMYGAHGAVVSHLTTRAINQLVYAA